MSHTEAKQDPPGVGRGWRQMHPDNSSKGDAGVCLVEHETGGQRSGTASGGKAGRLEHLKSGGPGQARLSSPQPQGCQPSISTGSQHKAWEGGGSLCAGAEQGIQHVPHTHLLSPRRVSHLRVSTYDMLGTPSTPICRICMTAQILAATSPSPLLITF